MTEIPAHLLDTAAAAKALATMVAAAMIQAGGDPEQALEDLRTTERPPVPLVPEMFTLAEQSIREAMQ